MHLFFIRNTELLSYYLRIPKLVTFFTVLIKMRNKCTFVQSKSLDSNKNFINVITFFLVYFHINKRML